MHAFSTWQADECHAQAVARQICRVARQLADGMFVATSIFDFYYAKVGAEDVNASRRVSDFSATAEQSMQMLLVVLFCQPNLSWQRLCMRALFLQNAVQASKF